MKIKYCDSKLKARFVGGKPVFEYRLVDSILKTHFKALMKLTTGTFDYAQKTGLICEKNKDAFLDLVEKIEKSDAAKARASHAKTAEKAKNRQNAERCEHEDLGSLGYTHGSIVTCPHCGQKAEVW